MALMDASLSGKLSHYWDMKTVDLLNSNYGNPILDRIGTSHMVNTNQSSVNSYNAVSGLNGSGVEYVGIANSQQLVVPCQFYGTDGSVFTETVNWGPGSGSFTIAWWDYEDGSPAGTKDGMSLANVDGTQASNELAVVTQRVGTDMKVALYHSAGSFIGSTTATTAAPSGSWKLWTLVVDKVSPTVDLYCNGSGHAISTNANIANLNYPGRNSSNAMGLNTFGLKQNLTRTDSVWVDAAGYKMDSVMVFNEPLTSGEVQTLYNSGSGVTLSDYDDSITQDTVYADLQHYYSFDEAGPIASGSTLEDSKGTADLTLVASTAVLDGSSDFKIDVSGAVSGGTSTSGSQDKAWEFTREVHTSGVGVDSAWNVLGSGEAFSMSYWFKGNIGNDNDTIMSLTSREKSNAAKDGASWWERTQDFSGPDIYSAFQTVGGTYIDSDMRSESVSTTLWNHVLTVLDPKTGQGRVFLNGAKQTTALGTVQFYGEEVIRRAWPGVESNDNYDFKLLGAGSLSAVYGIHQRDHNLDDVALFNAPLDIRHAKILYNGGSGFKYTEPVIASGSTSGFLGGYLVGAAIASGSTSGSVGGYVAAAPIASGSLSGFLGGHLEATSIASGSASGSLGGYIDSIVLAEGSSSGFLGGYMKSVLVSSGSSSGSLGGYLTGEAIASGSTSGSLGGYVFAEHVSSGSASGLVHGYVSAEAVIASGSASGSLGGYIVAVPLAEASGTITISRPPTVVYSWDTSKLDPSGYRHVESGAYRPAAKSDLIGGFNKQAESGVALNLATLTDLNPSSTVVGDTKALTVSLGAPSGQNFDNATAGDIVDGLRVYNIKMWMNDTSDVSASGINPTVYYRTDSAWTKDIALTSASSGVQAFPISEASGISLGSVESTLEDSEITSYVYLFVELPSGAYNQGVVGGLGGGYEIRVSYDFTGEGDLL